MTTDAVKPVEQPGYQREIHELKCLEVWGGSSSADHAASVPGLDIGVSARPYGQSDEGGDLYLISSCSSGWISRLLLADVSGHGDDVSGLSGQLRRAMHQSINTVDQSKLARRLNNAFDEFSEGSKFATALLMTYYAPSGHLVFINAGHPPPLLSKDGGRSWISMDQDAPGVLSQPSRDLRVGIKNLPLGVIRSTEYEQLAVKISPGDLICAYTDGYIEAQDAEGRLLGVEGLKDVLSSISPGLGGEAHSELSARVMDEITASGYTLADDDHTMLSIVRTDEGVPSVGISTIANLLKNGFGLGHTDTVV